MAWRNKVKSKKIISILLVVAASFLLANFAAAGVGDLVTEFIGWIISCIISALGLILALLMRALIYIAQYNSFISSGAVSNGWVIVRDLCNMFFVVILLVISFATILHVENYNYKKWLPKLVIMAILINFSKTICGLIIDFGQVIMLTFVNAFKDIGGANLSDMLGITDWMKIKEDTGASGGVSNWNLIGAYVLALIYVIISVIVITTMLAMLVMRMMMLWVYIVLSPAAYLLAAFPGGQKYSSQWWSEFTKNVIVGPVLAFFIWLSFVTIAPGSTASGVLNMNDVSTQENINASGSAVTGTQSAGSADFMVKFVISIAMLIGGLKIASEIGGAAGSIAGKGMSAVNKGAAIGLGGVAAVTGYNFAKRRFGAWREESKKKMQQRSDLVYDTLKGGAVGALKGAKNMAGNVAKQKTKQAANWVANTKAGQAVGQATGKASAWMGGTAIGQMASKAKSGFKAAKEERKARYEAVRNGFYSKDGKDYEYEAATGTYVHTDDKGSKTVAKDRNGKNISKMKDSVARFYSGVNDGLTKSKALKNQIGEERAGKKQKLFEEAGTSSADLKRIMNDTQVSKDKRLAAVMSLAIKEGFKNSKHEVGRKDVAMAKSVIGDNQVLLKKFNDTVNKKFAHLNYDLDSKDAKVKEAETTKFKQAMDNGLFDGYSQDSSAYSSSSLMKTLEDYSGLDFADNISSVAKRSKQHRNNVGAGLKDARTEELRDGKTLYDSATGELNKYAKLTARITGDVGSAFREVDPTTGDPASFNKEAATKYFADAKASWMNSFNPDQLKVTVDPATGTDNSAFVKDLQEAIANGIQTSTLVSMQRADQSPDLMRKILGIIEQEAFKPGASASLEHKYDEIDANNILKNIPRAKPPV